MAYRKTGKMAMWFAIGAGLGAVVALLYAPKKGKDVRRYITKGAEDACDYIAETGHELYEKGRGFVEDAGNLIERGVKQVSRA